jgi:hypothetical protein
VKLGSIRAENEPVTVGRFTDFSREHAKAKGQLDDNLPNALHKYAVGPQPARGASSTVQYKISGVVVP